MTKTQLTIIVIAIIGSVTGAVWFQEARTSTRIRERDIDECIQRTGSPEFCSDMDKWKHGELKLSEPESAEVTAAKAKEAKELNDQNEQAMKDDMARYEREVNEATEAAAQKSAKAKKAAAARAKVEAAENKKVEAEQQQQEECRSKHPAQDAYGNYTDCP